MRGTVLPVTLLCAALGLALGSTAIRVWIVGVVVLIGAASVAFLVLANAAIEQAWADGVYLACWITIAGTASSVYLTRPVGIIAAVVLALNAGVYCGAVSALTGSPHALPEGFLGLAVLLPAGWAAQRSALLPLKVASSWLVAIAALAAILQFLPVTPGYLPDHVE